MSTAVKPEFESKTFCTSRNYIRLKDKDPCLVNFKFYQKLFAVLMSLSTFLIFPESPRELENICERNNPKELCNVW